MKILQLINNLTSGGAEKLVHDLSIELKENGEDIQIVLLCDKDNVYKESIEKKGIKVTVLSKKTTKSLCSLFKLINLIRMNKFTVVHVHLFPSLYYGALLSLMFPKTKFIYTEHSTHNKRRDNNFFHYIERVVYFQYNKIVSISQDVQEKLIKWLRLEQQSKFYIINNGVDLDRIKQERPRKRGDFNFSEKDFIVTMVSRFSRQKDHGTLIKAIENLSSRYKLILVGEGKLMTKYKSMVLKLNLESRVLFLGFRKDATKIMKMSDCLVQSSYWEGFGLTVIEGMATGIPVLASDVEGMNKVINNESATFNVEDWEELSRKIKEIAENRKIREDLLKKNIINMKKYSLEKMAVRYKKLYL